MVNRKAIDSLKKIFSPMTGQPIGISSQPNQSIVKTKVTPSAELKVHTSEKSRSIKNFIESSKDNLKAFLSPVDDGQIYGGKDGKKPMNDWAVWVERTWRCCCGHTFRAPGIWVPSEPAMCEAPGCPNPKFFTLDCNKHYLDVGNKGAIICPPRK